MIGHVIPSDLYVRLIMIDHVIPRDLYVRLIMKRETATPTNTPTTNRVLTATPTSSSIRSPANLIGRSGGGKGSKQKVRATNDGTF